MARVGYVKFDEAVSDLSDGAFRVLCYLRCHMSKANECYPSIDTMSEELKRSERTCKYAIAELKSAGILEVEKNSRGRWVYRIIGAKNCTDTVQDSAPQEVQNSAPVGATHSATHSAKFCTPPNNPHIGKHSEHSEQLEHSSSFSEESKPPETATTTTTKNLEPFEPGNPAPLPAVRNAVEPFRPRIVELKPTEFKPETRDRMMSVLGIDAEQFARKVTQEQADAGFVDWIMGECKRNKTPGRLAFHLLKTAWREGWIDPKAEEEAKRAARRKRLEALR